MMRVPQVGEIWVIKGRIKYSIDAITEGGTCVALRHNGEHGGIVSRTYSLKHFQEEGLWECLTPFLIENE